MVVVAVGAVLFELVVTVTQFADEMLEWRRGECKKASAEEVWMFALAIASVCRIAQFVLSSAELPHALGSLAP